MNLISYLTYHLLFNWLLQAAADSNVTHDKSFVREDLYIDLWTMTLLDWNTLSHYIYCLSMVGNVNLNLGNLTLAKGLSQLYGLDIYPVAKLYPRLVLFTGVVNEISIA